MHKWLWAAAGLLLAVGPSGLAESEGRLDWSTKAVWIDQALPMPGDVPPKPGVIFADRGGGEQGAYSFYSYFTKDNQRQGDRVALGLLRGEFESKEWVEARAFGREGNHIRLELAYHPQGGKAAQKHLPDRKKRIAFSALFPQDLPVGEYAFEFELKDEQGQLLQAGEAHLIRGPRDNPLAALDDPRLVKEYIRRGEVLKNTDLRPTDGGPLLAAAIAYDNPVCRDYEGARHEIVSRGTRMLPLLIDLLKSEAVRNPGLDDPHPSPYGLSYDVMGMMRQLPDPRPVPLLVDIVEGLNGMANVAVRLQALTTLEAMTYVSFGHHWSGAADSSAVRHSGAVSFEKTPRTEVDGKLKTVAGLFREWLAGEGKDPSQWLPIARKRARELMETGESELIGNGIAFLQGPLDSSGHDDDPARTMNRIADLVRKEGKQNWYWLPKYGPRARVHIDLLLDPPDRDSEKWPQLQALADVGGEKMMERLVEALKQTSQEARRRGVDPSGDWTRYSDREERNAALAYNVCRWGAARWAGRVFADDVAIREWWSESKVLSQRQWLEQNLERTAADADSGNAEAQAILRLILPDLPHPEEDLHFSRPGRWMPYYYREHPAPAFRVAWVKENRGKLTYDEQLGGFLSRAPKSTTASGQQRDRRDGSSSQS